MSSAYLPKVGPAVGGGLPGIPQRLGTGRFDLVFAIPGLYELIIPDDFPFESLCALSIGAGGGASVSGAGSAGGGGGALAWANRIPVVPGQQIII